MPQWDYYLWNKRKRKYQHIGAGWDARKRWLKHKGKKRRELLSGPTLSPYVLKRETVRARRK